MKLITACCVVGALAASLSCTSKGKAEVTEAAFENPETRREMLEGTLRVLEANPAYVDEMFQLSLRHPKVLDRLFSNTAKKLDEADFARRVSAHLVAHPRGLRQTMIQTLEKVQDKPQAAQAVADAIEARAPIAAAILVDRPKQLAIVFEAIMKRVKASPDTGEKMTTMMKEMI